jgi:hypothetical protein
VFVEGLLVIDNLDIVQKAPSVNVSYVVTTRSFVRDTSITIDFAAVTGDPQINGIEIYNIGDSIPMPTQVPISTHPTVAPITLPPNSPPVPPSSTFQDVLINCGGTCISFCIGWFLNESLHF